MTLTPQLRPRMLLAHTSGMNSGADYRAILDENVETFRAELEAGCDARESASSTATLASSRSASCSSASHGHSLAAQVARLLRAVARSSAHARSSALEIPATEEDGWRGRVQGFVHDEKAYLMGGVAGHAGLFGTAADVAALTECYLGPSARPRLRTAAARNRSRSDHANKRTIPCCGAGWDGRSRPTTRTRADALWTGRRSVIRASSARASGPIRCATSKGVLLTNAVYFGRDSAPSSELSLRQRFYEAMIEELA